MKLTANEGTSFLTCDELGDVPAGAELGRYDRATRFLARAARRLDGERPTLLTARAVVARLLGPEPFSGRGVRPMASGEGGYNPLSHHNGSVWPHDTAPIAEELRRSAFRETADWSPGCWRRPRTRRASGCRSPSPATGARRATSRWPIRPPPAPRPGPPGRSCWRGARCSGWTPTRPGGCGCDSVGRCWRGSALDAPGRRVWVRPFRSAPLSRLWATGRLVGGAPLSLEARPGRVGGARGRRQPGLEVVGP
jgi:hypothetical protein